MSNTTEVKMDADLKRKLKNLAYFERADKMAVVLGFTCALCLKNGLNLSTNIDTIKELVKDNLIKNGHGDKVEEILGYLVEDKFQAAVPVIGYRLLDFFDNRRNEIIKSHEEHTKAKAEHEAKVQEEHRLALEKKEAKIATSQQPKKVNKPEVKKVVKNVTVKAPEPPKKKFVIKVHKAGVKNNTI